MTNTQSNHGIAIHLLDSAKPIRFAVKELSRYLQMMTGAAPGRKSFTFNGGRFKT